MFYRMVCLLLAGGFALLLPAQRADYALVYRVDAAFAERAYRGDHDRIDWPAGAPVDTVRWDIYDWLPAPGHYLLVSAAGEQVQYDLRSFHSFGVMLREDPRDLVLQVVDSTGELITGAGIRLNRKTIPFDPATGEYRLPRAHRSGMLRVDVGEESAYFELINDARGSLCKRRLIRLHHTRLGRIAGAPFRWGWSLYQWVRRGFRRGRYHRKPPKSLGGYIAFSQPQYRPGDTLRLKAYAAKPNGKPWRKPISLTVGRPGEDAVFQATLTPSEPGNFTFRKVLSDTLPLDVTLPVALRAPQRKRWRPLQYSFRLADYELDEGTLAIRLDAAEARRGERLHFTAEALDPNGRAIPGGQLRWAVVVRRPLGFFGDQVLLPDTLWTGEQALAPDGPTTIPIPDSIFPPADLFAEVQARLTLSTGEQQFQRQSFKYFWSAEQLALKVDEDTLVATRRILGKDTTGWAVLHRRAFDSALSSVDTVQLPHREPVHPHIELYQVGRDTVFAQRRVGASVYHQVRFSGENRGDSVTIRLYNPLQLPVH